MTSSDLGRWSADRAPKLLPKITKTLPTKIIDRACDQQKHGVGDTGIEPVTSSV